MIKEKISTISIEDSREDRIDRYLAALYPDLSRSYFKKLIVERGVLVDDHPVTPHHILKAKQKVSIRWPVKAPTISARHFGELPFPVLFEDEELLVINKPAGLLCHPAGARGRGTSVVDLLAHKLTEGGWPDELRPGLVHRLDKDTSGVLIFAKNPDSHAKIAKQFLNRQVHKTYEALVKGHMEEKEGELESHLKRDPFRRNQFAVAADGRWALTHFKIKEYLGDAVTWLELKPLTGRTHQLRVQLSSFHHPVLGDPLYGGMSAKLPFIKRQMLHAAAVEFDHPEKKKKIKVVAPLPDDFQEAVKLIRSQP